MFNNLAWTKGNQSFIKKPKINQERSVDYRSESSKPILVNDLQYDGQETIQSNSIHKRIWRCKFNFYQRLIII